MSYAVLFYYLRCCAMVEIVRVRARVCVCVAPLVDMVVAENMVTSLKNQLLNSFKLCKTLHIYFCNVGDHIKFLMSCCAA